DGEFHFDGYRDKNYSESRDSLGGWAAGKAQNRQPRSDYDKQLPGRRWHGHDSNQPPGQYAVHVLRRRCEHRRDAACAPESRSELEGNRGCLPGSRPAADWRHPATNLWPKQNRPGHPFARRRSDHVERSISTNRFEHSKRDTWLEPDSLPAVFGLKQEKGSSRERHIDCNDAAYRTPARLVEGEFAVNFGRFGGPGSGAARI